MTLNEWPVGDHKTHLEDQASKRLDQTWKKKQNKQKVEVTSHEIVHRDYYNF